MFDISRVFFQTSLKNNVCFRTPGRFLEVLTGGGVFLEVFQG